VLSRILWYALTSSRIEHLTKREFHKVQSERLVHAVRHAYDNSKFWGDWIKNAGLEPNDIEDLDDLQKLPVSNKETLMKRSLLDRMADDPKRSLRHSSSGTTGGPMVCFRSRSYYDYLAGYNIQGHYLSLRTLLGIGPFDRVMRIVYAISSNEEVGGNGTTRYRAGREEAVGTISRLLGPMHDYFAKTVSFGYSIDEILPEIIRFKPSFIKSNPSYLRLLADAISERGIDRVRPKSVMTGGEVLDEPTRDYLQHVFGCSVYQGYSASEVGKIAIECRLKKGLHLADPVIVEVLKDGNSAARGEPGNIVVTTLLNDAMPLLRYDLGDIGILGSDICECGKSTPILKSVEGREEDHLTLASGKKLSPKSVTSLMHRFGGLPRCQLVQEDVDVYTLRVFDQRKNTVVMNLFLEALSDSLGPEARIEMSYESDSGPRAKFRPVISRINMRDSRWTLPN